VGVKVLVVDNADLLDLVRAVLEAAGANVTAAASAREAIEAFGACGPFESVLSDIAMPEMDGYALIRGIRSSALGAGVPAVALTAYVQPREVELMKRAGYQAHLAKPVEARQLLEVVRALSDASRRGRLN
jgi:CheY-like chemotaxis protein